MYFFSPASTVLSGYQITDAFTGSEAVLLYSFVVKAPNLSTEISEVWSELDRIITGRDTKTLAFPGVWVQTINTELQLLDLTETALRNMTQTFMKSETLFDEPNRFKTKKQKDVKTTLN